MLFLEKMELQWREGRYTCAYGVDDLSFCSCSYTEIPLAYSYMVHASILALMLFYVRAGWEAV